MPTKSKRSTGPASKSRRQAEPLPVDAAATGLASGTVSSLKIGDRVTHQMFGDGIAEAVRDNKLRIKFNTVGSKEILSSFITPPH
jgi:DNA helicase-2/ATP-dependent DNA helicase PcrA